MALQNAINNILRAGSVVRSFLNTATPGSAVIAKAIAGAGISLSSTGADNGTGDVTISLGGGSFISSTNVIIANTTTKTTLWTFTIPAGDLGASGMLSAQLQGSYLNNSGANTNYSLEVVIGGVVVYADNTGNIATSTLRRPFLLNLNFANRNSANSNYLSGELALGNVAAATTGIGDIGSGSFRYSNFSSIETLTINTASAVTVAVNVTHSVANANVEMKLIYGTGRYYAA